MLRSLVSPLAALLLLAAGTQSAQGQATLVGTVRGDSSGAPLAGVEVLLEGSNLRTTTDPSGQYRLGNLPPGTRIILFRMVGYRPVRIQLQLQRNDTTRYEARLVREGAQVLDSLLVSGRPATVGVGLGREAFEERRARGFGKFIDTEELRRYDHRRVADVLRGIQGVNIVRFRENPRSPRAEERAASSRGEISMSRSGRDTYCWMSIMLDGHWLYQAGSSMKVPDLSQDIRVTELDRVEVYRSAAETPGEFSGTTSACGVILFWTKRAR